jgi:hypothetical protein
LQSLRPVRRVAELGSLGRITLMKMFDPGDQKTLRFHGAARVSFALAIIALAVGTTCIMGGQWGSGLILVFAAVAGVMTAWQMRSRTRQPSTDDDHVA